MAQRKVTRQWGKACVALDGHLYALSGSATAFREGETVEVLRNATSEARGPESVIVKGDGREHEVWSRGEARP